MTQSFQIELLTDKSECAKICDSILAELPDWFGPFETYKDYMDDVKTRPVFVASKGGKTIGIMALTKTSDATIDIHLVAIRPRCHGQGVGQAFVETAKEYVRKNNAQYLTVKTLGPSRENAAYASTRAFYKKAGFEHLEEFPDFWGEGFPMLLQCQKVSES